MSFHLYASRQQGHTSQGLGSTLLLQSFFNLRAKLKTNQPIDSMIPIICRFNFVLKNETTWKTLKFTN